MQLTFRAKLMLVVGGPILALATVIVGSALMGIQQTDHLVDLQDRMVPKLRLGPQLESEFDHLARSFQDAVAAQDKQALAGTLETRTRLVDLISSTGTVIEPQDAASLRWAVQNYYDIAQSLSLRLIAGETGETVVHDIEQMQDRQRKAVALIRKATGFDQSELTANFAALRRTNRMADQFRLGIGIGGLALVLLLSISVSRGMLRALDHLSRGFARFATGDLESAIPVASRDELGNVARDANQMAEKLRQLAAQRDRHDWLKAGLVGFSDELRGELEPRAVAERALSFLVRRIDGLLGAFYLKDESGFLRLFAHYGATPSVDLEQAGAAGKELSTLFGPGEGLVGRAAEASDVLVVDNLPDPYLKVRSGLGEAPARTLVLLPLQRLGNTLGVIELALFAPCSDDVRELLRSIRETFVIAFEAASSRAATRDLLQQTQAQAERLTAQEEELRLNNQELQAQQQQLSTANEELEEQRHTLSQKNVELEHARRRVQQKVEELDKVSSYKSQFLANMSHELRTPLNSMLLLSHLLAENEAGNLTGKQVEYGKTIHSAGQDLLALINQVLDLAKIEAGKQELDLAKVDLSQFAEHGRRVFAPLANSKGLRFVVEIAPGMPETMVTDRLRVERILTNLLGNAIKFTEQGEVALRIGRPRADVTLDRAELSRATTVAFSVSDTGIGIAPEAQERAFAPFEQIEAHSDRRFAGTGLGLTIARESATLLGGELRLESVLGQGSTFTCYLPERPSAVADEAAHEPTGPAAVVADDRASLQRSDAHLLLIEDDAVLAEQLVDIVRARGMKVVVARTGEEGLKLAKEQHPYGIILDVKLPDIDGWTVMTRLHEDPATEAIPVHFVTGVDAPERGLALGAIGYLTKPATHAQLASVVRTLTPMSTTESRRILVVEDNATEGESIVGLLRKENLDAHHVKSAGAALGALETQRYGCVVLDLGLPDMDGLGLLETLRARPAFEMPPVVIHTGRALTRKEVRQLEAYAESVVVKDGSSKERLLEEIRLFVRHVKESLPIDKQVKKVEVPVDHSLQNVKLLLAEDDMRTVYALSALLRGKGADVMVAETGREALDLLFGYPDIRGVLMDVMMPEMDGYEAMRRLRADPRFASLPVIALTARAMKGERERCLAAGASEYLTKPVDSQKLLSTLHVWLHGASNGSGR